HGVVPYKVMLHPRGRGDRRRRRWEGDQQTVSQRLYLPAAPAPNLLAQEVQAVPQHLLARLITKPAQEIGGVDQIGEEHRDEASTASIEARGLSLDGSSMEGWRLFAGHRSQPERHPGAAVTSKDDP